MADMLTKGLMGARLCQLSTHMGLRIAEGEEPVALIAPVLEVEPPACSRTGCEHTMNIKINEQRQVNWLCSQCRIEMD